MLYGLVSISSSRYFLKSGPFLSATDLHKVVYALTYFQLVYCCPLLQLVLHAAAPLITGPISSALSFPPCSGSLLDVELIFKF